MVTRMARVGAEVAETAELGAAEEAAATARIAISNTAASKASKTSMISEYLVNAGADAINDFDFKSPGYRDRWLDQYTDTFVNAAWIKSNINDSSTKYTRFCH